MQYRDSMTSKEGISIDEGQKALQDSLTREGNGTLLDWRLTMFGNTSKLGPHLLLTLPEELVNSGIVRDRIEDSIAFEMLKERLVQLGRGCKLTILNKNLLVEVYTFPGLLVR